MRKLGKLVVCLLVFAFLVVGCGVDLVAKVNGQKITEAELNSKVEQIAMANGHDLEGEHGQVVRDFLEEQLLEALIIEKLVLQDAKAQKIKVDKKKVKEELKNIKASFNSTEEYESFLAANKLTEKDLREMYETMFIYDLLFEKITQDITEPTQDLEEYYTDNPQEFFRPEMVQVRHVLVEEKETAMAIITALAEGADFKEIALEKSIDPSVAQNEGLMDYFPKGGYMVEEFEEAAFALKEIGEYTEKPVKTDYGYHVIKLEGRQEEKEFAFDEIKEQLAEKLLSMAKNERFQAYENELLEQADVERLLAQEEAETGHSEDEPSVENEE